MVFKAFHSRRGHFVLSFVLALVLSRFAQAQEVTIAFDPSSAKIEFSVTATLHSVHGSFAMKSGTIHFNPSGQASGSIVVDVKGGQTGNDRRDRKMHAEVLESDKYSEATFTPTHVS